jgi:hypothetical protein
VRCGASVIPYAAVNLEVCQHGRARAGASNGAGASNLEPFRRQRVRAEKPVTVLEQSGRLRHRSDQSEAKTELKWPTIRNIIQYY